MAKRSIFAGALILTLANIITRFIGFFYRIYISETIGTEGMGLYQLIMPIYLLAWTITSSGFTTTISKLTASENAKKKYGNIKNVVEISIGICVFISILLSFLIFTNSSFIALKIIKDERTALSLRILALCLPFMSAGSCIRGYFFGLQDSVIPSISQVFEQLVRIGAVFSITPIVMSKGLEYACAAAVIGIALGEFFSFGFVLISYFCLKEKNLKKSSFSMSKRKVVSTILSIALPLTFSRVIGSLLSTAENILIPQRLVLYGLSSTQAIETYGSLTGMAMPLLQLPSAFLMAFSISLVPAISEAAAIKNKHMISLTSSKTILFTFAAGLGISGIFFFFPKEMALAVYNKGELGNVIFKLSIIYPLVYLQITLSGLLNGLGKHKYLFVNNIASSIINIFFIYFFMPKYGIDVFILSLGVSLLITVTHSIHIVLKTTGGHIDFINFIIKPFICILTAGTLAKFFMLDFATSRPMYILVAGLTYVQYLFFLIVTGAINRSDIKLVLKH